MAKKKAVEVEEKPKKGKKAASSEGNGDGRRSKFGTDLRITGLPTENWRRAGTKNHERAQEVMAFLRKNPKATVAELIAETSYRRNDFEWDLKRDVFKTVSA
jgi:hypothetical protein